MKRVVSSSAILLALAIVNGAAAAESSPKIAGGRLVDASGMTLYTFDKDAPGKSNCNAACANAWPPASAASDEQAAGDFTVVTRDDGSRQWALRGRPLYRYAGDAKAGDVNGDLKGNVWHAIGMDGAGDAR